MNKLIDWLTSLDNLSRPLYPSQAQEVAHHVARFSEDEIVEEADRGYFALCKDAAERYQGKPDHEEIVRHVVRHLVEKGIIYVNAETKYPTMPGMAEEG